MYMNCRKETHHACHRSSGRSDGGSRQVYLNQAAHLTDGQRIYVPSREEEQTLKEEDSPSDMADAGMGKDTGIINLNTATKAELLSLSGIGESRAEAIIAYRETNGGFRKIEDLKKVGRDQGRNLSEDPGADNGRVEECARWAEKYW